MSQLRFCSRGSGFPLLLLHGFGVTYNIWENLGPLLESHFQLIIVELPGMGPSASALNPGSYYANCVQDLEQMREELQIEKWSIFSYSIGTRVAEAYINRYPHRIGEAVFLCPLYIHGLRWKTLSLLRVIDLYIPHFANRLLSGRSLYGLVVLLGFNGHRSRYAREWVNEISSQDTAVLKKILHDLPNSGKQLFDLPVPSLYIFGRHDIITARSPYGHVNVQYIRANHSAPLLAADQIAKISIAFYLINGCPAVPLLADHDTASLTIDSCIVSELQCLPS